MLGLVPVIGASPGRRGAATGRQPARARSRCVPRSEVGGGRVLPVHSDQHPLHVTRPTAQDDGRDQPEPPGGEDDHRDQPGRHDGRGGQSRPDRRHRHAAAAASPVVRRAQPDGDLHGHRGEGDAGRSHQAHGRTEPGRPALRARAPQSVGAASHGTVRRGVGRHGEALRSDHPRLAPDLGRDGSCRAGEPRRRRRAGHQGRRDHARGGDARAPSAGDRQGAAVRRGGQRHRLLEPGLRLRVLLPELLPLRLHVRERPGDQKATT